MSRTRLSAFIGITGALVGATTTRGLAATAASARAVTPTNTCVLAGPAGPVAHVVWIQFDTCT